MDVNKRTAIYDRLLAINLKIEVRGIPDPQYLNEKIGECHVYLEEIERYSIEIYRDMSVLQVAYNNAKADYETKKETLLSQDQEIKSLPNIKDREARVNSRLRVEQEAIKNYENESQALGHLLKAVNLKTRNLNNANKDISAYIKIMESQIRLGNGPATDKAVKSLMDEFKKSTLNQDSFEDVETVATEEHTIDPSAPMNINDLLSQGQGNGLNNLPILSKTAASEVPNAEPTVSDIVPEALIDPNPALDPEKALSETSEDTEETLSPIEDDIFIEGMELNSVEIKEETTKSVIDLDQVIDFNKEEAKPEKKEESKDKIMDQKVKPKPVLEPKPDTAISQKTAKTSGIDLDALLEDLNITKKE